MQALSVYTAKVICLSFEVHSLKRGSSKVDKNAQQNEYTQAHAHVPHGPCNENTKINVMVFVKGEIPSNIFMKMKDNILVCEHGARTFDKHYSPLPLSSSLLRMP